MDEEGIQIVKELAAGERFERPYPDFSFQGPATGGPPGITLSQLLLSCTVRTADFFIDVMAQSRAILTRTIHQVAMISATFEEF